MKDRQTHDDLTAPAAVRSRQFYWGWGLGLGLVALLVGLISLPPFVGAGAREVLMQGFASVCHQIPERSPSLGGVQLAVCHRCFGIYGGLPLAMLLFLFVARWEPLLDRYARWILPLALVPAGVDWLLGVLHIWENTPLSRMATGLLVGLVGGLYMARAFGQLFRPKPQPATDAAAPGEVG